MEDSYNMTIIISQPAQIVPNQHRHLSNTTPVPDIPRWLTQPQPCGAVWSQLRSGNGVDTLVQHGAW